MIYKNEVLDELISLANNNRGINIHKSAVTTKQKYIFQWEDIIQSFDCGLLALLAFLYTLPRKNSNHNYKTLNKEILSKMSFDNIFKNKTSDSSYLFTDLYKYIQNEHLKSKIILDDNYIESLKLDVYKCILSEENGQLMLFQHSPFLCFMNGIMALYSNDIIDSMTFVLPNIGILENEIETFTGIGANCLIDNFFTKENKQCPISIDYNKYNTFYDYIVNYRKNISDMKNYVIVSTSKKLYVNSLKEDFLSDVSLIFPENEKMELTKYSMSMASVNYKNEYISYINEAYRSINDLKEN